MLFLYLKLNGLIFLKQSDLKVRKISEKRALVVVSSSLPADVLDSFELFLTSPNDQSCRSDVSKCVGVGQQKC